MRRYAGIGIALAWSILLNFPHLYAWAAATRTGGVFAGSVVNLHDHNAYLASVQDGMQGNVWLGALSFITEPNLPPALQFFHASPFYRILGWLYGLTGLPVNLFYLVVALILAPLAFGAYSRLFAACLSNNQELWLAKGLLFAFPGLLWINQGLQEWPEVENYVPRGVLYAEAWGNVSLNPITHNVYMPHFVAATIGVALLGHSLVQAISTRRTNIVTLVGFSLLVSMLLPSLGALWVAIGASLVAYAFIRWGLPKRNSALLILSFGPAGLLVLWVYQLSFQSEFWATYLQRAISMTGKIDFWLLALHLGVLGPLALWGGWLALRARSARNVGGVLAALWLLWTVIIALANFTGSPRFMDGIYLPAIILASRVIAEWRNTGFRWSNWRFVLVACFLFPGTLLTYVYPWVGQIFVHFVDQRINLLSDDLWPIRLSADEGKVLVWLQAHVAAEDVVAAGPVFGSFVPGFTGRRVYLGHIGFTLDFDRKLAALGWLDSVSHLPGLYGPTTIWLVNSPREPLPIPSEIYIENEIRACTSLDFTFGEINVTQYSPC